MPAQRTVLAGQIIAQFSSVGTVPMLELVPTMVSQEAAREATAIYSSDNKSVSITKKCNSA